MKILVGKHELKIDKKDKVNQNEYKVTKCEFEFDEAITNDLVKIALFTNSAGTYKQYIINNKCYIPAEILEKQETTTLGVYAYKEENEELELRYSPEEIKFYVSNGSYKEDAENTEPITPTDKEQMEQALQNGLNDIQEAIDSASNLDIEVSKEDNITTVEITKQDGTPKSVEILDGEKGEKGDKGDTGETGPQGPRGEQGIQGPAGNDAKINNVNTLNIEAGDNITLEQQGNTLKINSTGGGSGGTSTDVKINGTSITSGDTANIAVEGTYNASTNKLMTKSEVDGYDASWISTPTPSVADFNAFYNYVENGGIRVYTTSQDDNQINTTLVENVKIYGAIDQKYIDIYIHGGLFRLIYDGTKVTTYSFPLYEDTHNKVTTLSRRSRDDQYPSAKCVYDKLATKQDTLVSGTNIKTINNESILGSGNINIQGGSGSSEWGNITGTLSDQADLQTALNSKANTSSIPTKVSQLTNDSGYQNATQVQTAINNAIGTALGGSY